MTWVSWLLLGGWVVSLLLVLLIGGSMHRRLLRLARRVHDAERLAELGTLTGGLAHEIKNPLSTVQLNLQLLMEDLTPDNPAYSRLINRLNTVQRETTRLREILDDFLRYGGKMELERKPTELNEMLEDLMDFYMPQAQLNRVQLRLKRTPEPLIAWIDPRLVKQAVLNLMLNATQAMGEGGGELILSAERSGNSVIIDVIDTGRGIEPEDLPHIFKAYYSKRRGGTGLGLAMARRIVEEHGGSIDVRSQVGKGSDFRIHLPIGKGPEG